ncbi:MAG: malto-oligosyltrehalose synthase [Dehalococcoidales bacterium]|nr:malto-oligosyltrehalose synthase [Dehalococcoidales bacterium]
MSNLEIPIATYRLQFNKKFRFSNARTLVPYLHQLGISDLYASPIFKARTGSLHGYDVTDPSKLNPELGTEEQFETLFQRMKHYGMGFLADIVPNHMAISNENHWWMDLLENGLNSPYASFFDINWNPINSIYKNKIIIPILDTPYCQAFKKQNISLKFDENGLFIHYKNFRLPLSISTYNLVLTNRMDILESAIDRNHPIFKQFKKIIKTIECLNSHGNIRPQNTDKIYHDRQIIKQKLWQIFNASPEIRTFISENITLFSNKKKDINSFYLLNNLLSQQIYQLVSWKTSHEQINYRRFFDIIDLIGIHVEIPQVFETTHAFILRLINEGKITGIRIDHIDGLINPLEYLSRFQHYANPKIKTNSKTPGIYMIVEKILSNDELLPHKWPVFGTTGYDFLNAVNAVFIDSKGMTNLGNSYSRFTGSQHTFDDITYNKKRQVAIELFPAELHALGRKLAYLYHHYQPATSLSLIELTNAIIEITANFPVYRTYTHNFHVSTQDRSCLEHAIKETQKRNPQQMFNALDFVGKILLLKFPKNFKLTQKNTWLHFVLKWQQFTGTIMAKGLEDTVFYNYNRLLSLNEVGGNPELNNLSVKNFHRFNLTRLSHYPHTMNTTATHDTKRGEDTRTRLNVLSEIPELWDRHLKKWNQWNQSEKKLVNGQLVPDSNMQVLLYQTMLGSWPLWQKEVPEFKKRLKLYIIKAAREAKVFTSWFSPDIKYESALLNFVEAILQTSDQNIFLRDFMQFQQQIAYYGVFNSLAQVLLKITSPGVPDFYQGTELWDFSLVDPDNRRPIDYQKRREIITEISRKEPSELLPMLHQILTSWKDGKIKFYLTYKALNYRQTNKEIFQKGNYIPLQANNNNSDHICAFARQQEKSWALTIVPRLMTKLVSIDSLPVGNQVWGQDLLILPKDAPENWFNVFTNEKLKIPASTKGLPLSDIFSLFPVALLVSNY